MAKTTQIDDGDARTWPAAERRAMWRDNAADIRMEADDVAALEAALTEARRQLRMMVVSYTIGLAPLPIAQAARAARVSRETVYQWQRDAAADA